MGTGLLGNPELSVALLYLPANTRSVTLRHLARGLLHRAMGSLSAHQDLPEVSRSRRILFDTKEGPLRFPQKVGFPHTAILESQLTQILSPW